MQTPTYVKALLKPSNGKGTSRKVWSIDLEAVWLPFFTATNVTGDTALPLEALGAPLRLAKDKDGSIKFSKTGRPVFRVAPELSQATRMVRDNFTASLISHATKVAKEMPKEYKAQVEACHEAGVPIVERAQADIEAVLQLQTEEAQVEAEKIMTKEAVTA